MEPRDQVWVLYGPYMHSNHSKLSDITTGKLSVKSQFTTHHSNQLQTMVIEWSQSSTHGFDRVRRKLLQKADLLYILQGNTERRMKVYWTHSPFLVKL